MKIRNILRPLADLIGHSFRLVPHRWRFELARRVALRIAPLVRHTPLYTRRDSKVDGHREETLRMLIRTMTRTRVTFAPKLEVLGRDLVPERTAILISGHFLLNSLTTRWIHDSGRRLTGVVGGPREPMFTSGLLEPIDLLYSGTNLLVEMRSRLADGRIVFIDLDDEQHHEGWTRVDTAAGPRFISLTMFRFAARLSVPVIFTSTIIGRDGRVVAVYRRPSSNDPEQMLQEFGTFLREEIAKVLR